MQPKLAETTCSATVHDLHNAVMYRILVRGPLHAFSVVDVTSILYLVADALAHVHSCHVIHNDVKCVLHKQSPSLQLCSLLCAAQSAAGFQQMLPAASSHNTVQPLGSVDPCGRHRSCSLNT